MMTESWGSLLVGMYGHWNVSILPEYLVQAKSLFDSTNMAAKSKTAEGAPFIVSLSQLEFNKKLCVWNIKAACWSSLIYCFLDQSAAIKGNGQSQFGFSLTDYRRGIFFKCISCCLQPKTKFSWNKLSVGHHLFAFNKKYKVWLNTQSQ